MESRQAVWTLRQDKRQGNPAGFRLPPRHGQSMTPVSREFAFPFPDSQPGESQDTRLDNSHGCCPGSRVQRPVSAVVELFRQGEVPIRHRTDLEKQKRQEQDRNWESPCFQGLRRLYRSVS